VLDPTSHHSHAPRIRTITRREVRRRCSVRRCSLHFGQLDRIEPSQCVRRPHQTRRNPAYRKGRWTRSSHGQRQPYTVDSRRAGGREGGDRGIDRHAGRRKTIPGVVLVKARAFDRGARVSQRSGPLVYRDDDPALSTVFANCSHRPTRVDHGRKYVACWRARCVELPALSVARGQNWLQTGAVSAERAQHQRGRSLPRRGPSSPSRAPADTPLSEAPRHAESVFRGIKEARCS